MTRIFRANTQKASKKMVKCIEAFLESPRGETRHLFLVALLREESWRRTQLISCGLAVPVPAEKLTVSTGAVKIARDEIGGSDRR
jgi:hypothetical protein